MNTVISQPRYIPALNYIARLCYTDLFVVFDTVQRQPREPHNRNRLLCNGEPKWVTIPINASSRAIIHDMKVAGSEWIRQHKDTIRSYYLHAPFFDVELMEIYYEGCEDMLISSDDDFTAAMLHTYRNLGRLLSFEPKFVRASEINDKEIEQQYGPAKLLAICRKVGADLYISGPVGREYGVVDAFSGSGVDVLIHEYTHPVYQQIGPSSFVPYMGFFDALFNIGRDQLTALIHQPLNLVK
ncbi:MAG: WbqC family protein [Bacteroidales bacterium]|nr:WbqC family protein [Bacteroidales bacterium]